jgi:hypothetical protein
MKNLEENEKLWQKCENKIEINQNCIELKIDGIAQKFIGEVDLINLD